MTRYLVIAVAVVVGFEAAAQAGGPPPVYVVVDRVVLEPSADTPERIRIEGTFVRLQDVEEYRYGKPVEGSVYLGIETGKEAESRAEWARWQKAAGTGKVVAVGDCGRAGSLLTVKIHKPGERVGRPDAAYTSGHLGELDAGRGDTPHAPVRDLLAFVKAREQARKAADQRR
jgi:hypothetical protein